ncbi:MAG: hypothetical protein ACK44T_09775, partial [Sphingomonadales bacterium]
MTSAKTDLALNSPLLEPLLTAMTARMLPGDNEGFDGDISRAAAAYLLAVGLDRAPGSPNIGIETFSTA